MSVGSGQILPVGIFTLTRPQSSLMVSLIINEGCAGTSVGGDGKAERRETTGKSCFQDGGRINGGFCPK